MKIAWVSHSLVNERQYRFVNYVENNYDVDILQVYPSKWGEEKRENGYTVSNYHMGKYLFEPQAFKDILDFQPDVIYLQNELWSMIAVEMARLCEKNDIPLSVFVWENLNPVTQVEKAVANHCQYIICGNQMAKKRLDMDEKTHVLPQVGIDTTLFTPGDNESEYDIIFPSRPSEEKGWNVLQEAVEPTNLSVYRPWEHSDGRTGYSDMVKEYRKADICCVPSIDQDSWIEQFNYSIGEALSTGLSVVASDSGAIPETWNDCDAVEIVNQNDPEQLKQSLLDPPCSETGREFVKNNYGYKNVSERLISLFSHI